MTKSKIITTCWTLLLIVAILVFASTMLLPANASVSSQLNISGITLSDDGNATWTVTNGTSVTATVSGRSQSAQLYVQNTSGAEALISFTYDWNAQGSGLGGTSYVTVNGVQYSSGTGSWGTAASDSGTKLKVEQVKLASGSSITIALSTSRHSDNTATVTLYDFSIVTAGSVTTTFNPVSGLSYTVKGNDTHTVNTENGAVAVPGTTTNGFTITPPAGYILVGFNYSSPSGTTPWENDGTNCFKPTAACTVTPVFTKGSGAPFKILGTGKLYYTWHSAFAAAAAASGEANKTVVLNSDFALPNGTETLSKNLLSASSSYVSYTNGAATYSVPSGCRFLIPFDSGNTADFDEIPTVTGKVEDVSILAPSSSTYTMTLASTDTQTTYAYRTLRIPSDTTVSIQGSMNVNSGVFVATLHDISCPHGAYGLAILESASSRIAVQSGGSLYCYGYIMGSFDANKNYTGGTVTAKTGAVVCEMCQVRDWRGGNSLQDVLDSGAKTVPISQYYVQNIEADYIIESGATSKVNLSFFLLIMDMQQTFDYIGSTTGLFQLSTGSMTRSYNPVTERTTYTVNENSSVSLANIVATFNATITTVNLDSASYILGINNNMTVNIASGATVALNQRVKILPGAQLNVHSGGELIVSPRDDTTNGSLYVYDYKDWASGYTQWAPESNTQQSHTIAEIADGVSGGTCYRYYNNKNTQNDVVRYSPSRVACNGTMVDSSDGLTYPLVISKNNKSASAKLVVNGTLTCNGNVFTSSANTTPDTAKIITGTGTFKNNAAYGTSELDEWVSSSNIPQIASSPAIALLTGISTGTSDVNDSFGVGTYYGLGEEHDNYWYQYRVIVKNGEVDVTSGYETGASSGVVAYVANSNTTAGTVSFTVKTACNALTVTATNATTEGTYTLKDFTADSVVTISHTIENGVCTECKRFPFYATNVNLGNNLDMLFAFRTNAREDWTGCYVVFEHNGESSENIPVSSWRKIGIAEGESVAGETYYVVSYSFAAKEMCDYVTVTVYDASGNAISTSKTDSIHEYAHRIMATNTLDSRQTLIVDMLNYGAACQVQFGYNIHDLANAKLTDAQKAAATTNINWTADVDLPSGSEAYPANLVTESNIRFAIGNVSENITYTFTNHWGTEKKDLYLVYQEPVGDDPGYYYINTLVVADARCVIKFSNGVEDSIEAYCKRMIDNGKDTNGVFTAFMKFSQSAHAYLHRNDTTEVTG